MVIRGFYRGPEFNPPYVWRVNPPKVDKHIMNHERGLLMHLYGEGQ